MSLSKVLPGDSAIPINLWSLPEISEDNVEPSLSDASPDVAEGRAGEDVDTSDVGPLPTAEQLEAIERQAYTEGFERGRREGVEAGEVVVRERVEWLDQRLAELAKPFNRLDQVVEEQLVALVIAVARQLVRRELRTDPGMIVAAVREGLSVLPVASGDVRIHLNAEDAALVRDALSPSTPDRAWTLVEEPALVRGDCRITTQYSRIDAGVETRFNRLICRVFGGEGAGDPPA